MDLLMRFADRIRLFLLSRFFRLREVEEYFEETDGRYLNVSYWASIRGITKQEAEYELEEGVSRKYFEKQYPGPIYVATKSNDI